MVFCLTQKTVEMDCTDTTRGINYELLISDETSLMYTRTGTGQWNKITMYWRFIYYLFVRMYIFFLKVGLNIENFFFKFSPRSNLANLEFRNF